MEVSTIRQDTHCEGVKTVQYLLGELKALITGQGSVAERLLSHLEQAVSSPLLNDGDSNIQTESVPDMTSLHRQNVQLRRRVQILNQQLKEKEKAERRQNMDSDSEVATLQEEELTVAQSRLQELRRDVTELRTGLQDREAQNALIRTDLEATRSRLVDAEREKSELAALAQQGLEEIGRLKRMLQSRDSSECPAAADTHQPPTEHVARYLMSLGRLGPAAAQRESGAAVHLCDVPPQRGDTPADPPAAPVGRSRCPGEVQPRGWRANSTLSQCDVESLWSDWSARSGSTFDTRDEAAFRDGLAALDASIASLQKTIQLDLRR
ncbi:putative coiled-coil domain-containing protein 14 [Scophthalmus maximus]|uniref:Putative coiled-coil domain-containing protein 14 n=1 Tax=Scophthalmus maximus TaxID=52904 RepID=A0A2U9AW59_SCOMX|nr:putative coiled-coil domain-containing protein 14 [Scophthalmus maximus]